MVSITSDLGVFSGETLAEAKKILRKAEKDKKKADKEYDLAVLRSKAQAYEIAFSKLSGKVQPRGWTFFPRNIIQEVCSCKQRTDLESGRLVLDIEGKEGGFSFMVHKDSDFVGHIENGSGFCVALVFNFSGDSEEVSAIAVNGEHYYLSLVPGIKKEDFKIFNSRGKF